MPTVSIMKDTFAGLKNNYGFTSEIKYLLDVTQKDINDNDVIVFIRPNDLLSASIAKKTKKSGRFVITFCDDDLLRHKPMMPWRLKALKDTMKFSDVFWSSNSYLNEKYLNLTSGKRAVILDTIIEEEQIENCSEHDNEKIKIVYAANPSHVTTFDKIARAALPEIIEKYGEKISFTFVSVHPELKEFEGKTEINYVKGMPLQEYRKFMADQKFDIGLSPLNDDEFTRCKYFNKYIEYTMSGVCGIYSKVIPYVGAVKNEFNGLIAENSTEGWVKALELAIENPKLRESCIINAQIDLRENFNEQNLMNNFVKNIPELVKFENKKTASKNFMSSKIMYYCFRPLDWAYLVVHYLKVGGMKKLADRIKIHFREKGMRQK